MNNYNVIGLMSGTSLDGLDLVYLKFDYRHTWSFSIIHSTTVKYSLSWIKKLKNLVNYNDTELLAIDIDYSRLLAREVNNFINDFKINRIDAVCSHGHTALHKPEEELTYQIGNRRELSKLINCVVVCDFRVQDVKLGGQGAPLVPIGDELLFSEYDFCLNLGGFANISLEDNNERIAFDICPTNIVLNYYANKLGLDFDSEGKISKKGNVNESLLAQLNNLKFYSRLPPKSLGLEWVNENIFPLIDSFNISIGDVLRTFVEHIAIKITNEFNKKSTATVLITGGGVFNTFLINRIKNYTNTEIILPSKEIIEYKEALIFGLLGVLKLRKEINCLKSVTGAKQDHSSGVVFHP